MAPKARCALLALLCFICSLGVISGVSGALFSREFGGPAEQKVFPEPRIPFSPPHYVCYRAGDALVIDGKLDEPAWKKAAWTEDFVDIEGSLKPKPRFRTHAKMLWDENFLYFGADLEEPDIWATLTQRDSIIFYDNDFEIFIDPDGDTHNYYELEVNALGTAWDLFLVKPYRDTGPAIHSWDIQGLETKVFVDGSINNPGDRDRSWSVEIAVPWDVLKEAAPGKKPPLAGDQWRVDFSRVEYWVEVKNGTYAKIKDPQTGKVIPEDNWVWAPTGLVNIHYPEMWAYVQFSDGKAGEGEDSFIVKPEEAAKWALRQVYYKEKTHHLNHGKWTESLAELGLENLILKGYSWPPRIKTTWNLWEAALESEDGREEIFIASDGRINKSPREE